MFYDARLCFSSLALLMIAKLRFTFDLVAVNFGRLCLIYQMCNYRQDQIDLKYIV